MEAIVAKLLVADNATIQQGTRELREALKKPGAVQALFQLVFHSTNPQIRQLAVVLLRKKFAKRHAWHKLSLDIKTFIKQNILQALISEGEKSVKNAIAQLIATISKHEFAANSWPEVLQFIQTLCNSETYADKELGMYALSVMTEISVDQYLAHIDSFGFLFTSILSHIQDLQSSLAYYTLITMKHFAALITGHQQMVNIYHNLMPRIIECVRTFATSGNEHEACEVFELLDELVECAANVVAPSARQLVQFCLELATAKAVADSVRVKAITFIGWLTRTKPKSIQKNKLVEPIVDVLFTLMSAQPEDEGAEEYFTGDADTTNPMTCATQTLDLFALHIPADKLIPPLLQYVEPALRGDNLYAKKASYLVLAVLAEGCSECIRTKYLQSFLQCICKGITDPNAVVRNAALFALGQFAEHLQPEISEYASELLPVLFEYLSQLCAQLQTRGKEPPSIDRMFYALEMFCENLDDGLLPYLPTLMERLFFALDASRSVHLRELALSALAAAANAAKEAMMPYFDRLILCLKEYLVSPSDAASDASDAACLQAQAVDTLGVVARQIGADNFRPLADESLQLALNLVTNTDDPDVRKSAYGLFSALATILHNDIAAVLPQIVEQMLDSIRSSDGIVSHYKEDDVSGIGIYDELSDETDAEEDLNTESSEDDQGDADDDVAGYSVENAYIEEKEEACLALKEIAECAGASFLPYLESSFQEIVKLLNYPQEDIRKAAVAALTQFCVTLSKVNASEGRVALAKALRVLVPKCAELIRADEERAVVMAALDAYTDLLKACGADVLQAADGHREAIMNCVIDVLTHKTACQDQQIFEEDADGDVNTESEQDEILLECAGEIIPHFGSAIQADDFALYFPNILTLLQIRAKKQNSVSQRSFAVGTLAECMQPLGGHVAKFVPQLLPLLLQGSRDAADEVRNNSIFALGEMVLNGSEHVYQYYGEILEALSQAMSKEKHAGSLDNICGALARMILANAAGVPLEQVFPVFVRHLPLREDFDENDAVFRCLWSLYQQGHELLAKHLHEIIVVAANVLHNKQTPNKETKALIVQFLKTVQQDFSNEFNNVVATALRPEVATSLQQFFQDT